MNSNIPPRDPRYDELLAEQALFGLTPEQQTEWEQLAPADGEDEIAAYEQALAALQEAICAEQPSQPPAELTARVLADAQQHFAATGESARVPGEPLAPVVPIQPQASPSSNRAPWLLAAAALLLAVAGWWPQADSTTPGSSGDADAYASMIAEAPADMLRLDWTMLDDPSVTETATGEIVWSDVKQRGYMRFDGLAVNDPTVEQYQLWIFDRAQDDAYPVDGGVFNVTADGEVIVPIDPKIGVSEAWQFAITVEKPGGVVVSSRERLPMLATTSS